nr:hypothetical protein [Tanacetum cinerariifolium]
RYNPIGVAIVKCIQNQEIENRWVVKHMIIENSDSVLNAEHFVEVENLEFLI